MQATVIPTYLHLVCKEYILIPSSKKLRGSASINIAQKQSMLKYNRVIICAIQCDEADNYYINRSPFLDWGRYWICRFTSYGTFITLGAPPFLLPTTITAKP